MAKILKPDSETIKQAGEIIRNGGLVAFPTETVYGLGASAYNPIAIAKIFEIKKRPRFDPIIVHIQDICDLKKLAKKVTRFAEILTEKFWPGPLTLVLYKSQIVPDIVTSGLDTVAIRMPANQIALELIRVSGVPVGAPSANLFGRLSPTSAEHVAEQMGENIDFIIDGGKTRYGIESTVIDLTEEPVILRPGPITREEIESLIGPVKVILSEKRPRSPGQMAKHYAPRVPLKILRNKTVPNLNGVNAGFLAYKPLVDNNSKFKVIEILSQTGDLREAASNLFSALHRLENSGVDIIYAEPVPEKGIGYAIMDRLRKAEGLSNE